MKEPTYRDAAKVSWQLAWHHKSLWLFGLFAAFLGQMGVVELITKVSLVAGNIYTPSVWIYIWRLFSYIYTGDLGGNLNFSTDVWVSIFWLIVILVGFGLLLVFVSVVSQGAIVRAVALYTRSPKKFPNTSDAWHHSHKHFWRLLALNILRKVIVVSIIVFVGWATANAMIEPSKADIMLFLILFVVGAALGMVLSFWLIYAVGYIVVEEYRLTEAVRAAWRMFTNHWLVSIEVALILFVINIGVMILAVLGLYTFFLPSLLLWFIAIFLNSQGLFMFGIVVGLGLFSLFIMFVGSIFTVFTTSIWTYLFMKMHKEGLKSRLLHWIKK